MSNWSGLSFGRAQKGPWESLNERRQLKTTIVRSINVRSRFSCRIFGMTFTYCSLLFCNTPTLSNDQASSNNTDNYDIVLTPTRLRQSAHDTPAGVTVLSREVLRNRGVTSIAEAMRLVPGMVVLHAGGHDYRISYHGTNGLFPRRMQLLIDGISWYRTGFALIPWATLPISIDEIERIEVTRSPSSPAYGANSFFAVINIITRHPEDYTSPAYVTATAGSLSTQDTFVRYAGRSRGSSTSFEASFAHKQNTGYDTDNEGEPRHDDTNINIARWSTVTDVSPTLSLSTRFGLVDAELQDQFGDSGQVTFPDIKEKTQFAEMHLSRDLSHTNRLDLTFYATHFDRGRGWRTCVPTILFSDELRTLYDANPAYAQALLARQRPTGGSALDDALLAATLSKFAELGTNALANTCGDINEDIEEYRFNVELQDTAVLSEVARAVVGAAIRYDSSDSETLYGGKVVINSARVFTTFEWKPTTHLVINVGGTVDYDDLLLEGTAFSPRVAANIRVTPNQTWRVGFSKAIRTPDPLAEASRWNYTARNLDPLYEGQSERIYYLHGQPKADLKPEMIEAYELGYYVKHFPSGVTADVRIFHEELTQLMSEKPQLNNYEPTNNNAVDLNGAELELRAEVSPQLDVYGTFARINNQATTFYERTLHAKTVGAAALTYTVSPSVILSAVYYRNSDIAGTSYDRYDVTVRKSWRPQDREKGAVGITLKYQPTATTNVWRDVNAYRENRYDDRLQAFLTFEYGTP